MKLLFQEGCLKVAGAHEPFRALRLRENALIMRFSEWNEVSAYLQLALTHSSLGDKLSREWCYYFLIRDYDLERRFPVRELFSYQFE